MRAEDIKAAVPLDRLLQFYNYAPNRAGYISCPFHPGDQSPSLRIYSDQNSWHCFGCQRGGSIIDFAMQSEGVDFRSAVQWLAETFGVDDIKMTPTTRRQNALKRHRQEQKRQAEQAKQKQINDKLTWLNLRADSLRDRIKSDYRPFSDPVPGGYGEDIAYAYAEYARIDYLRKEVMNE